MAITQEKQLGFFELLDIGKTLEKRLLECSNKEKNILTIFVDEETFTKIDEDMYYRQFPDGKDFHPSDKEILINFIYLTIVIAKKESE